MKEINKKLIKKSFWFALLIILFSYLFFPFISYTKLFYSAKKIDSFNNTEFLRIKIYGSSSLPDGNTISGTFSIIDSKGAEIAVIKPCFYEEGSEAYMIWEKGCLDAEVAYMKLIEMGRMATKIAPEDVEKKILDEVINLVED